SNALGVKLRLAATESRLGATRWTARCQRQLLGGLTPTDAACAAVLRCTRACVPGAVSVVRPVGSAHAPEYGDGGWVPHLGRAPRRPQRPRYNPTRLPRASPPPGRPPRRWASQAACSPHSTGGGTPRNAPGAPQELPAGQTLLRGHGAA